MTARASGTGHATMAKLRGDSQARKARGAALPVVRVCDSVPNVGRRCPGLLHRQLVGESSGANRVAPT
jgi:hypothetical protein